MKLSNLDALLHNELKDLYSAEAQLIKALPKMAKEASSPELQEAFTHHLKETKNQAKRLEQIGRSLGLRLTGKKCKGMEGLVEEGKEVIEEDGADEVRDLALITGAQRVEYYEIASYSSLIELAGLMQLTDAVGLLEETLKEEVAAKEKLAAIAEGAMPAAAKQDQDGETQLSRKRRKASRK